MKSERIWGIWVLTSDRRYVNLEKIVTFQEGYVNPSQTNHKYFDGDVKWLRAVDLNDSEVWDTSRKLSVIGFESAGKSALMFKPNTIAISKSGTIGRLGILKDFMCGNRAVINIEVDENQADLMFVFYSLIMARREIIQYAVGSVQANLYPSVLGKLKIWLPSLSIQRKISSILSSLDEMKIINQNVSTKSEEIISALYRSWFIDFDPVTAKAEGRLPHGMDEETAALFPDSFENSENGELPKGWTWGTLLDISKIWTGGTPKTSESSYWGGDIPWVSGADLSSNDLFAFDSARKITSLGVEKSSTKVLPVGTVMITARGTVGATKITAVPMAMSQTSFGFKAKKGISDALVYQASQETIRQLRSFAYGAVFDTFTQSTIDITKIAIAPMEVLQAFGKIVDPLFETMKNSAKEIIELSSTRDALLPRLMSGELTIPEVI